jgi:hypothetical protein
VDLVESGPSDGAGGSDVSSFFVLLRARELNPGRKRSERPVRKTRLFFSVVFSSFLCSARVERTVSDYLLGPKTQVKTISDFRRKKKEKKCDARQNRRKNVYDVKKFSTKKISLFLQKKIPRIQVCF